MSEKQRSDKSRIPTIMQGIAHDFRNILSGLMGNIELAQIKTENNHPAKTNIVAAKNAVYTVNQLISLIEACAPCEKTEDELTDISKLLVDITNFLLNNSNVYPRFNIASRLMPVKMNAGQASRIISNIVINAKEAMPGGGNIFISAVNHKVKSNSSEFNHCQPPCVEIIFKDEGSGIPPSMLRSIFSLGFSTKENKSGNGLPVIKKILHNYKGRVEIKSSPGQGTSVHVFIPAVN